MIQTEGIDVEVSKHWAAKRLHRDLFDDLC